MRRDDERAGDTIPEQAGVYVPPRPLASLSDHRTMDVKAIRLAAEVDPRQALTELRLEAPRRRAPRGWLIPVAFAVLAIGFIALWWATPGPLPLGIGAPESASPTVVAPSPPLATAKPAPVVEPAPLGQPTVRAVAPQPPLTAAPAAPLAAPATPARTATPRSGVTTVVAPSAAATAIAEPSADPAASTPHRPKGGRDPWLD